jgi:hypothetical protein
MKEERRESRNKDKVVIQVVHGQGKLEKNYGRGKEGKEKEVKIEIQVACGMK